MDSEPKAMKLILPQSATKVLKEEKEEISSMSRASILMRSMMVKILTSKMKTIVLVRFTWAISSKRWCNPIQHLV